MKALKTEDDGSKIKELIIVAKVDSCDYKTKKIQEVACVT